MSLPSVEDGAVTVQRTALQLPMPLSEHGLAYHLASVRGEERKEILLDFAWTAQSLTHNYQVLNVDPTKADALLISHGHLDHYGALPTWRVPYTGGGPPV